MVENLNRFYVAKIVEAKSIKDALKKEKNVEPYDIRRTTNDVNKVHASAIGFASPHPQEE